MSKLFLAENQRDSEMLDLYTRTTSGTVYVWASVNEDLTQEVHNGLLHDKIAEAEGKPVEVVLITRKEYDELVEMIEAGDGCD